MPIRSLRHVAVTISLTCLPAVMVYANTQAGANCPIEQTSVVTTSLIQAGVGNGKDSIISIPYTAPHHARNFRGEAALPQTGSVYGLAYHAASNILLSGAFLKRFAALGPYGTGAIYATNRQTGQTTLFADINRIAGAAVAGADPRGGNTDWFHDANAFDSVGFAGLGDIDLSEDQQTLYAVSLGDRKLYQLDTGALDGKGSLPVTQFKTPPVPIPTNACSNPNDARPMGIGVNDGKVYVGVTCTAQSTVGGGSIGDTSQLKAAVYRFDPEAGQFAGSPVLSFPLNYPRGCVFSTNVMSVPEADCFSANWRPWQPDWRVVYGRIAPGNAQQTNFNLEYPQPWVSDVEFDRGDMLIGLRDLNGDRTGYCKGSPDTSENPTVANPSCKAGSMGIQQGNGMGDILRACANGSGWTLEGNGSCGGQRTAGQGNAQGPQGGEYYWNDQGPGGTGAGGGTRGHHQTVMGALLQLPQRGEVVTTALNPFDYYSAGVEWFSNQQGNSLRRAEAYNSKDYRAFGKANGLGDLEWVCGGTAYR